MCYNYIYGGDRQSYTGIFTLNNTDLTEKTIEHVVITEQGDGGQIGDRVIKVTEI